MTIFPNYGTFVSLPNGKIFNFVAQQIATQKHLPVPKAQQIENIAMTNADKLIMPHIHDLKNPYYVGEENKNGDKWRLCMWVNPLSPTDPSKMVLIQEKEYAINGEKVIVPDRMMVGPKAPILAFLKMSCCDTSHCSEAPYSVVPCYSQDGQTFGKLRDPVAGILNSRPKMFSDGIYVLGQEDLPMVLDLATHLISHSRGIKLPKHDCHNADKLQKVELGKNDLSLNPN